MQGIWKRTLSLILTIALVSTLVIATPQISQIQKQSKTCEYWTKGKVLDSNELVGISKSILKYKLQDILKALNLKEINGSLLFSKSYAIGMTLVGENDMIYHLKGIAVPTSDGKILVYLSRYGEFGKGKVTIERIHR